MNKNKKARLYRAMGGKKVGVERPRAGAMDDSSKLPLETLSLFQKEDQLNKAILARLLSGVSTRKYVRTIDGDNTDAICTSKSEVSRRFIEGIKCLKRGI